jgi:hypothetical protein
MYVTRISRYIYVYRSVLSAVSRNRGRSLNVLPVDTGARLYMVLSTFIAHMMYSDQGNQCRSKSDVS